MDNIFFDLSRLKKKGNNVIIGKTVRIRYPELVEIGNNCIIDDFTYISTSLVLEANVHISSGCKIIGGRDAEVIFREYSTLAPGVVLAAGSDDYTEGLATPMVPHELKGNIQIGTIEIGRHSIVGSNTVVLPNVHFGTGAAVGALSLVKNDLADWSLYAGIPAKLIKKRNKDQILAAEKAFRDSQ